MDFPANHRARAEHLSLLVIWSLDLFRVDQAPVRNVTGKSLYGKLFSRRIAHGYAAGEV
jgi:hypothetical protein